jgi:hypothetical protein
MLTIHFVLLLVAFILALLAAFNVPSRVGLFPLAFALFLLNALVR